MINNTFKRTVHHSELICDDIISFRTVDHSKLVCDNGWIYKSFSDKDCSYAICDGKTNFNGACNIYYSDDQIITRSQSSPQRSSGGSCTGPNSCIDCNDGFYSDGPKCRICSKINNCNHRRCTTATNQKCMYCEGDVVSRPYWRAYTPEIDDANSCQKTCSWRADSTRCYPGTCANELAANCICSGSFTGNHCEKIMDDPTIAFNHAAFYDKSKLHKLENNPNYLEYDIPVYWTNFVGFSTIETSMDAKYLQPPDTRDADHYVTAFRVGLIVQKLTVSFYKNGIFESSQVKECSGMDRDLPVDSKHCSNQFILSYFPTTLHNDKIMFAVSAENGGYLDVHNRETDGVNRYYYEGNTLVREFEFHWDLVNPYHCSVTQGLGCDAFASVTNDITDNPNIDLSFGGWADDLSGLSYYDYDVYDLGHNGVDLIDGMSVVISQTKIHVDNRAVSSRVKWFFSNRITFTVPRSGL
ncbi:unnamed protein product [Mytilus edulis]|uniref:EGF-like domain-containing protein n=1 Tax=Mytilus edulis TaxID=6550 RepID=A0A8S3R9E8_MYTED|nr:unnamed protein product [Mytilus edulis]